MSIDPNRFKREGREALRRQPMMHARRQIAPPASMAAQQIMPVPATTSPTNEHSVQVTAAPQQIVSQQPAIVPVVDTSRGPEVMHGPSPDDDIGHVGDLDYGVVDWTASLKSSARPEEASEALPPKPVATSRRSRLKPFAYSMAVAFLFVGSVAAGVMSGVSSRPSTPQDAAPKVLSEQSDGSAVPLSVADSSSLMQGTNSASPLLKQYTDTFLGTELSVAIQYSPDDFKSDPEALQKLAAGLKASTKVPTQSWGMGYLLTGDGGSQVLVFANATYLIVVQSQSSHVVEDWRSYVENFKI